MEYKKGDVFTVISESVFGHKLGDKLAYEEESNGVYYMRDDKGKLVAATSHNVRRDRAAEIYSHGCHATAMLGDGVRISCVGKDEEDALKKVTVATAKVLC